MAIHESSHLIAVIGGKGGVGKSVFAANLAYAFMKEMKAKTPEGIRQIFEPFYTTKLQGSGLGLAAVANVVRSAGGWLMVKSTTTQPGRGTEVSVYLPLAAERVHQESLARNERTLNIAPGQHSILEM